MRARETGGKGVQRRESSVFEGVERSFLLTVPEGGATPKAMLIALHGSTQRGSLIRRTSGFDAFADEGVLLVYPDALGGIWRDGRGEDDVDDVGFLSTLVEDLCNEYAVPRNAVFIVGASNGGFMVQRLLCEAPELFRAAAAVISTMGLETFQACFPARVASMFVLATEDDPIVPFHGGEVVRVDGGRYRGTTIGFEDMVEFWLGQGDWHVTLPETRLELEPGVWLEQKCFEMEGGEPRMAIVRMSGVGHHWFGKRMPASLEKVFGRSTEMYSVSREVWRFFSAILEGRSCTALPG
ncbi:MAG: alpha/beta hydrolase family esterase [bacterium]